MRLAPLLCVSLLAAASAQAEEKPKLLVLDLKTTGAVDDDTASLVAELIAVSLSDLDALEVFAGADVRRMMELEADKVATGCEDDGSCIADIAGALGARYVIYGRLGKLGSRFVCTLNLFDAQQGKAIEREDIKAENLDALGDQLELTLRELVSPLLKSPPPPPKPKETPKTAAPPSSPPVVETDPDAAMRATANSLIVAGGATAGLAYGCGASLGLLQFIGGGDLGGVVSLIPVAGAALWPVVDPASVSGVDVFCYSCSGVQLVGLAIAGVGLLLKPPPPPNQQQPVVISELELQTHRPDRVRMAY